MFGQSGVEDEFYFADANEDGFVTFDEMFDAFTNIPTKRGDFDFNGKYVIVLNTQFK